MNFENMLVFILEANYKYNYSTKWLFQKFGKSRENTCDRVLF